MFQLRTILSPDGLTLRYASYCSIFGVHFMRNSDVFQYKAPLVNSDIVPSTYHEWLHSKFPLFIFGFSHTFQNYWDIPCDTCTNCPPKFLKDLAQMEHFIQREYSSTSMYKSMVGLAYVHQRIRQLRLSLLSKQ